ncbi:hypothetical protein [Azospirillum picis]|uniref:Uncharacterized protein n=1 Tax=Azospirillum picis TaxID=488438 RepID=A0ABU0MSP7_9PROT|nr:hypothetical protein [Azospirillum picis]MBP2302822.1 hypothetical protein [Azospirillum picis]MDQ0536516.1 hypothetical protein [Azospirillum picis]
MTTDARLSTLLSQLVANERHHEDLAASGQPYAAVEEDRNDKRAELEAELFSIPAAGMRGIAAKLAALWPDVAVNRSYGQPPSEQHDLAVRRFWKVIQEVERLADAVEQQATGH